MKELKANLDLYGVLLKLKECEQVFSEQLKINVEKADGFEYPEIQEEFMQGLYHAINATKDLIGESALNEVYDIIIPEKI